MRRATFLMRSVLPTDVPPYFWTISVTMTDASIILRTITLPAAEASCMLDQFNVVSSRNQELSMTTRFASGFYLISGKKTEEPLNRSRRNAFYRLFREFLFMGLLLFNMTSAESNNPGRTQTGLT
jgi:hypothetical protein